MGAVSIALITLFVGMAIGMPLCWLFISSSVAGLLASGSPVTFLAGTFFHAVDNYVLTAVAFFIFAMVAAQIMPRVSSVSGVCRLM